MSATSYTCVCKRTFAAQFYFNHHQRSCSQTKKRLSSAISSFKELLTRRKKSRNSRDEIGPVGVAGSINIPSANPLPFEQASPSTTSHHEVTMASLPNLSSTPEGVGVPPTCEGAENNVEDMSLAQRRPRRQNRRMPLRFRDVLPQPPPTVPLEARDRHLAPAVSIVIPDHRPVCMVLRTP
jgi:hypothetical protein